MRIDNSRRAAFSKCPDFYRESYRSRYPGSEVCGIELKPNPTKPAGYAFGARFHELLEEHFKGDIMHSLYPPSLYVDLELEAQTTFAAYKAAYPIESFTVLAVEQVFEVPIPGSNHIYIGKFDGIIRTAEGQLAILEHKTEGRGKGSNLPEQWTMKPQVSLYMWAAAQIYGEPIAHTLLDVIIRQSPKGREPVMFYRDILERTEAQMHDALADIVYWADQIEAMEGRTWGNGARWPRNCDQCHVRNWQCDFLSLHSIEGDDSLTRKLNYQSRKEYLTSCQNIESM